MISAAMGFALGGVAAKVLREADMDAFRLTQIRITGAAMLLLLFAFYRDWETDRKSTRLNSSHRL